MAEERSPEDGQAKLSMARFAVDESIRAVEQQLQQVDARDLKTSFIAAGAAALLAGLAAFAGAHPPATVLDRAVVAAAALAALVALLFSLKAWHPRNFKGTPSVSGLKAAVDGHELVELREMLDSLEAAFERNNDAIEDKLTWLERANVTLGVGAFLVAASVVAEFGVGK